MIQINIEDRGIVQWHPGDKPLALSQPEVRAVRSVYACGESLVWIARNTVNLPLRLPQGEEPKHTQWFGDDARFIVANLLCP